MAKGKGKGELVLSMTPENGQVTTAQEVVIDLTGNSGYTTFEATVDGTPSEVTVTKVDSEEGKFSVKSTKVGTFTIKCSASKDGEPDATLKKDVSVTFSAKDITAPTITPESKEGFVDGEPIVLDFSGNDGIGTITPVVVCVPEGSITCEADRESPTKFLVKGTLAGTGHITFKAEGYKDLEISGFTFEAKSDITVEPTGDVNLYTDSDDSVLAITEEAKAGTNYVLTVTPQEQKFVEAKLEGKNITVKPLTTGNLSLKITRSDGGINAKDINVVVQELKTIQSNLSSESVKVGEEITLTVTEPVNGAGIEVTSSVDGVNVTPKENGVYTISATKGVSNADVVIKAKNYAPLTKQVSFMEDGKKTITVQRSADSVEVGKTITATVSGTEQELHVQTSDTKVTPSVQGNVITLSASEAVSNVTVTVTASDINEHTFNVSFTEAPKKVPTVTPSANSVKVGQVITATAANYEKPITAAADNEKISVQVSGYDLTVTATEACSGKVTVKSESVADVVFSVEFTAQEEPDVPLVPSVDKTNIVFNESELQYDVHVKNLNGKNITDASSNSSYLSATISRADVVSLRLVNQITTELNSTVTIKVQDSNDIVLTVKVINDVEKVERMECDGKRYTVFVNEEASIIAATPPVGQELLVEADSDVVVRKDISRVYAKSAKAGTYAVKISLDGYKTATCTLEVKELPSATEESDIEYYDLGKAPVIQDFVANDDNFVEKVFVEDTLNDKQKLCYILEHGIFDYKNTVDVLCEYQQVLGVDSTKDKNKIGGDANFRLYSKLKAIVSMNDYYRFKSCLMVALKVFKVYKDDAFKAVALNRFDSQWNFGSNKLKEYKELVTLLSTYITNNGANMNTNGLSHLDESTKDKFNRFFAENIKI